MICSAREQILDSAHPQTEDVTSAQPCKIGPQLPERADVLADIVAA